MCSSKWADVHVHLLTVTSHPMNKRCVDLTVASPRSHVAGGDVAGRHPALPLSPSPPPLPWLRCVFGVFVGLFSSFYLVTLCRHVLSPLISPFLSSLSVSSLGGRWQVSSRQEQQPFHAILLMFNILVVSVGHFRTVGHLSYKILLKNIYIFFGFLLLIKNMY